MKLSELSFGILLLFTGNTYPGAQAPFGMVQLSPDMVFPAGIASPVISIRTARLQVSVTLIFRVREPVIYMIYLLCL